MNSIYCLIIKEISMVGSATLLISFKVMFGVTFIYRLLPNFLLYYKKIVNFILPLSFYLETKKILSYQI